MNIKHKIAVIGSGAVGGYFGGKLAQAGFKVHFLARGQHLAAMQTQGLTIKSVMGDFHIANPLVHDSIDSIGPSDLILLGVKSWQISEIAKQLKPLLKNDTAIIPLQNGIMATDELIEVLGDRYILGGLCRIFSKVEAPGVINHFAYSPSISFGELNRSQSERTETIRQILQSAGIKAFVSDDIQAELWRKFLFICSSGLLAVTRCNYGTIRSIPQTRTMLEKLFTEIYSLAKAAGIALEDDIVAKNMAAIDKFPPDTNCSLTRDIIDGKPSELEYQNGTVVKLAEQFNLNVPVNSFIYSCLLPQELRAHSKP